MERNPKIFQIFGGCSGMNKELKTLSLAVFHVFKLYGHCLIPTTSIVVYSSTSINAMGIQHFAKDSGTPPRLVQSSG